MDGCMFGIENITEHETMNEFYFSIFSKSFYLIVFIVLLCVTSCGFSPLDCTTICQVFPTTPDQD